MERMSDGERSTRKKLLIETLQQHGIPLHEWGNGSAKTVDHLLDELLCGECRFTVDENGELIRTLSVVGVEVVHMDEQQGLLRLVEERQVFNDAERGRRREHLKTSISEKIRPNEDVIEAAYRAIEEELGIVQENIVSLIPHSGERIERVSQSYPGLKSIIDAEYFQAIIGPDAFKPGGYTEIQDDKITYFGWRPYGST